MGKKEEVFPEDSDDERCPQCKLKAFVDGTYGTAEVPGKEYPAGYKLCLNCGYDEWPGKYSKVKKRPVRTTSRQP